MRPTHVREGSALGDSGVVKHSGQAVEQFLFTAERFAGADLGFVLFNHLRWNRGRE